MYGISEAYNKEDAAMKKVACVGILVADVMTKPVDSVPEKGLLSQRDSSLQKAAGETESPAGEQTAPFNSD